jgi:tetratricopeptide (TPR) repeat protein
MYQRYKSKRKYRPLIQTVFMILLSIVFVIIVYSQRDKIVFWKQDISKLQSKTAEAERFTDYKKRIEFFRALSENIEKGKAQNFFDANTFLLSGRIYFLLGESYLGGSFSELFSEHRIFPINRNARDSFIKALRDINKGIALLGGTTPADIRAIKIKAEYYLSYRDASKITSSAAAIALENASLPIELARFCALAVTLDGDRQLALKYLNERGGLGQELESELFLAAFEYYSKMYTPAIMRYRKILSETDNDNFKRTALLGLAQIYYDQSLDREMIEQVVHAHQLFPDDPIVKKWVEKLKSFTNNKPALRKMLDNLIAQNESRIEQLIVF